MLWLYTRKALCGMKVPHTRKCCTDFTLYRIRPMEHSRAGVIACCDISKLTPQWGPTSSSLLGKSCLSPDAPSLVGDTRVSRIWPSPRRGGTVNQDINIKHLAAFSLLILKDALCRRSSVFSTHSLNLSSRKNLLSNPGITKYPHGEEQSARYVFLENHISQSC